MLGKEVWLLGKGEGEGEGDRCHPIIISLHIFFLFFLLIRRTLLLLLLHCTFFPLLCRILLLLLPLLPPLPPPPQLPLPSPLVQDPLLSSRGESTELEWVMMASQLESSGVLTEEELNGSYVEGMGLGGV